MLASGRRLGRYEVRELIGAGGMGEVFRAHDSRLGRDVALKVLSERFKLDPHRLARFERETQVLASLNHSNIATLYGIEALGDTHALVLELVEGETLAGRIARGPVPLTEALEIAQQIAAALDAAHEHGVVHRDLKPGNVKLRPDGTVKLLDFGLAKISDPVAEGSGPQAATATALECAAGGAGVMGTPAYMSPEQARGLPVDKRSDVWAFGCVLYEMLTAERAFGGERSSDVVAKVIECEPDLDALPSGVPRTVHRLLRRCLEKDPRRRLRDMGDARLDLMDAADNRADEAAIESARPTSWRSIAAGAALAAAVSAMIAGTAVWLAVHSDSAEPVPRVARFSIPAHEPPPLLGAGLAISSDGMQFAYVSDRGLTVRARDRLETAVVVERGTVLGSPFFSPDGKWLGFTGWDTLRKVPTAGGLAVTLADSAGMGSWTGEHIVFADMHGLFRISADGGEPEELFADPNPFEQAVSPQFLSARQAVVFTVIPTLTYITGFASNAPGARVDVLDLKTGERRTILRGGGRARYVPTGHLIYAAGGTLYAAAFDLQRLEVRGDAVPVVSEAGLLDFAVSDEGTLVYQAGEIDLRRELVWVDRQGREEPLGAPLRPYLYPRLSPDGTRVALDVLEPDRDIWMWDLRRNALERFTRDPAGNPLVEWSPDGRYLVFGSDRFGATNLFRQASDGSGEPERLLESDRLQMPVCFPSEERLLFSANVPGHHRDIHALTLDGNRRAEPLIYGPANELNADVSPEGRWIAYDSDESGQFEVYVRSYPDPYNGGRWQISSGGGRQPLWSSDGTELYYRDFNGAMMAASVTPGPTFTPGPVVMLFENAGYGGSGAQGGGRTYDLSADGRRFLMLKAVPSADDESSPSLVVALNWFEELKRLVPVP